MLDYLPDLKMYVTTPKAPQLRAWVENPAFRDEYKDQDVYLLCEIENASKAEQIADCRIIGTKRIITVSMSAIHCVHEYALGKVIRILGEPPAARVIQ